MKKILITGGQGDLAMKIFDELSKIFIIEMPNKVELDVSVRESVETYFSNKSFDIVINAAGTLYSSTVVDSDPELWIQDVNVNLIGTYLVSHFAIKRNCKTRIINIASTAAFNSYSDWTSYCASKAGVLKLSMGMVKDGHDVVVLCPGAVDTKIRNGLSIENPNIMEVNEGVAPIIDAINLKYKSGDVIFYRKNFCKIIKESDVL